MMMIKSQAQQTTSPLFVDEEENNLEDVGNTLINTALPFDRCVKIDKEFEEELEDREVQMDKREFLQKFLKLRQQFLKVRRTYYHGLVLRTFSSGCVRNS